MALTMTTIRGHVGPRKLRGHGGLRHEGMSQQPKLLLRIPPMGEIYDSRARDLEWLYRRYLPPLILLFARPL